MPGAQVTKTYIATDDERIARACRQFGADIVMTAADAN